MTDLKWLNKEYGNFVRYRFRLIMMERILNMDHLPFPYSKVGRRKKCDWKHETRPTSHIIQKPQRRGPQIVKCLLLWEMPHPPDGQM